MAALDLSVPPLALLVLINVAAIVVALVGVFRRRRFGQMIIQLVVGAVAVVAIVLACGLVKAGASHPRERCCDCLYVIWKLPMYVGLARREVPKEWLRTGR